MFVTTKTFCRDKHTFVSTKDVFCRDKHVFDATKIIFVASPASDNLHLLSVTSDPMIELEINNFLPADEIEGDLMTSVPLMKLSVT